MRGKKVSEKDIVMKVKKGFEENIAVKTEKMNKTATAIVARSAAKDERLLARRQLSVSRPNLPL